MKKGEWTEELDNFLKTIYKTHEYSISELAEILGVKRSDITTRAKKIGVSWIDLSKIPEDHKYCKKCDTILHKDLFYKNKTKPDGLASNCKECQNNHRISKLNKKIIELKTCPKCKIEKEVTEFSKNQTYCKSCNREYNKNKGVKH